MDEKGYQLSELQVNHSLSVLVQAAVTEHGRRYPGGTYTRKSSMILEPLSRMLYIFRKIDSRGSRNQSSMIRTDQGSLEICCHEAPETGKLLDVESTTVYKSECQDSHDDKLQRCEG